MSNITIVGAGMMGSALAFPARENGHRVRLTGTHLDREIIAESKRTGKHPKFDKPFPAGVEYFYFEELAEALEGADMVICGVNSFGVDWFMQEVLPHIPDTTPVLSVTKGLVAYDDGTLISYPEYWERSIAPRKMNLNAVGGPCTSYELVAHDQTIVTFCGRDMQTLETLRGLMCTDYYHIHLSTEVMGVESAVALKNAYALGVALAVGLNEKVNGVGCTPHYNSQAAMFYQSVKEIRKLLTYLTGNDRQIDSAAGDMYVTIFGGRTRLIGTLLGRGYGIDEALAELKGVTLESLVIIGRINKAVKKLAQDLVALCRIPAADAHGCHHRGKGHLGRDSVGTFHELIARRTEYSRRQERIRSAGVSNPHDRHYESGCGRRFFEKHDKRSIVRHGRRVGRQHAHPCPGIRYFL